MPTLELTDEHVTELALQLPPDKQEALLKTLLTQRWSQWAELSRYGQERIRQIAFDRGRDWVAMTEDEREEFLDDLLHED
jgi:hypothetical protein